MKITPGLAPDGQGRWGPVHDYYVVFWKQPLVRDADRLAGATQEDIMWAAAELYARDAGDVHEVISWAEEEGHRRRAMYTLYAVIPTGDGEGLVWLAGVNPTDTQTNFERCHPVDVDPVGGTPAEVYGPVFGNDA